MKTTNYFKAILLTAVSVMLFSFPGNAKGLMDDNPKAVIYHPDSTFVYNFEENSKEIYSYDIQQNLVSYLIQLEGGKGWVDSELTNYTYDENGHLLTATSLQWNGMDWINAFLSTYTYDDDGNLLTDTGQYWDETVWVNSSLSIYTYDENGNKLTYINQYWDTDAWYNSEMDAYTYDENGNELTDTWSMWEDPDWVAYMMTTKTYDENGNRLTVFEQYWDGEWMNSMLITYTYDDNNNILNLLAQQWMGDYWENMSRAEYTYDVNGNCLSRLDQWWMWSGEWQNLDSCEYEYQPGMIAGYGYTWNDTVWEIGDTYSMRVCIFNDGHQDVLWDWGNCHQIEVYYSAFGVGVPEKEAETARLFYVYPNPASENFTITTEAGQSEQVIITLFDISGKEIRTVFEGMIQPGAQSTTLNTNDFPAGLYILEMRTATNSSRQKISIVR